MRNTNHIQPHINFRSKLDKIYGNGCYILKVLYERHVLLFASLPLGISSLPSHWAHTIGMQDLNIHPLLLPYPRSIILLFLHFEMQFIILESQFLQRQGKALHGCYCCHSLIHSNALDHSNIILFSNHDDGKRILRTHNCSLLGSLLISLSILYDKLMEKKDANQLFFLKKNSYF